MVSARRYLLLAVFAAAVMFGQPAPSPAFEVASVKRNSGGQGPNTRMNSSAGGMRYIAVPLLWIVAEAYSGRYEM